MCRLDSEKFSQKSTPSANWRSRHMPPPGCQVLIAKDGNIFYNKAFGHHTYKQTTPNKNIRHLRFGLRNQNHSHPTGHNQTVRFPENNLAAPLSDYYPPLKRDHKKDITVQEVLCHNAGLKNLSAFIYGCYRSEIAPRTFYLPANGQRTTPPA